MKKIGITGGIGSGKTTVCGVFEILGVPVYYADERAKQLMTEDGDLAHSIRKTFGPDSFDGEGNLNRLFLAQSVFANEAELAKLSALVHPAVLKDFEKWVVHQSAPYVLKEAALIFEAGSDKMLDAVIVVTADEQTRIQRIMDRDGVTRDAVILRMRHQMPQVEKLKRADFVIENSGKVPVIPQVLEFHHRMSKEPVLQ